MAASVQPVVKQARPYDLKAPRALACQNTYSHTKTLAFG
jgi:hypothetical protein